MARPKEAPQNQEAPKEVPNGPVFRSVPGTTFKVDLGTGQLYISDQALAILRINKR